MSNVQFSAQGDETLSQRKRARALLYKTNMYVDNIIFHRMRTTGKIKKKR